MSGTALTDVGTTISIAEAVKRASAGDFHLSVMNLKGQVLWHGRGRRVGSLAQYLSLCAEEGMSTAPGSSAPPAQCHIHHVNSWASGGLTDIDAMTLVDYASHGRIDDSRTNDNRWWTTKKRNGPGGGAGSGRNSDSGAPDDANPKVTWIPPRSKDPTRAPRENRHPLGWLAPGRRIRRHHARQTGDDPPRDPANPDHGDDAP